jgi:spore coat protein U-like protein
MLLLIGFGLLWCASAHADITCSASMSDLTFGTVDPQSTQTDSSATLSYTCKNDRGGTRSAMVCFSIGEPGGGSYNPRQMHDTGGDTLNFQLYKDPTRRDPWGSLFFGFSTPAQISITLGSNDHTSGQLPLYGRVLGGQLPAPGLYTDQYGSGDTAISINQRSGHNPPNSCGTDDDARFGSFLVSANVVKKCTVTASTLDFGTANLLAGAVTGSSTVSVQCAPGVTYNVGLDAGQHGGGDINARKMVLGTHSVAYQLYRDSGRTQVWGTTIGSNTETGTGNGSLQNLTVYGSVPAQTTPIAGTYNDTVTVTVTY